jgi:hypothetical protein
LGEEGVEFFGRIVPVGLDVFEADEGLLVEEMTGTGTDCTAAVMPDAIIKLQTTLAAFIEFKRIVEDCINPSAERCNFLRFHR